MFFINGVIPQKTTLYKSDSEGRLGVWAGNSIKYFLNITCVKIPQKTTLYKSDSEGRLGVWAGNSIKYFLNITCVKILKSEK